MQHLLHLNKAGREKLALYLIILTGLMAATAMLFNHFLAIEFIDHPQFAYFHEYTKIKDKIAASHGALYSYYSFFVLDMIWAPMALLMIYNLTRISLDTKRFLTSLLIFSIAAYAFDLLEGIGYTIKDDLFGSPSFSLAQFVRIKVFLYTVVVFHLLIALYQNYVTENLRLISQAILASFLSIIIIVLILFLATKLEQGSTVIIHLLDAPFSIFVCVMIVFILALACAHYPDYIKQYFFPSVSPAVTWSLQPAGLFTSVLGMGIIHYTETTPVTNAEEQKQVNVASFLRKNLGSALLFTWIYSLLFVLDKYTEVKVPVGLICFALLLAYLFIYNHCYNLQNIRGEKNTSIARNTVYAFIGLLASLVLTLLSCLLDGWVITCMLLIVTAICNLIFYVYFQFSRGAFTPDKSKFLFLPAVGDIVQYLKVFAFFGWCALFIYFIFLRFPTKLSSLCFILIWMYLLYGVIVILIKHNLFYQKEIAKSNTLEEHPMAPFFKSYIPILGFLIIGLMVYAGRAGNGLHVLAAATESVPSIPTDTFAMNAGHTKYFLATYGGGLRATIWTMLLLNSQEMKDKNILDSTAAMSGVSGGFLGLSFYTALVKEYNDLPERANAIDRIGKQNMLSIDISYMLGPDLIKEAIPYWKNLGKDRAARSMEEYANLIQGHSSDATALKKDSYRSYWTKTYLKNGYMPVLICNTTGTNRNYGIAYSLCPVGMNDIFPGSDNILDVSSDTGSCDPVRKSITYLGATSTTERFPIFSPAAEIEGKGHFVDGGYFENSGLLSLKNFRDYYLKITTPDSIDPTDKFILIINSKDDYIRMKLDNYLNSKSDVPSGEFSSILATITDTDILPQAMEARCDQEFGKDRFIRIYLPYKITFEDVIRIIGDEPTDPFAIDSLIQISNNKIDAVLKESYATHVYPALARVLSDPAYKYMKDMLRHEEVQAALGRIH
jgi:hypothetical protein